MTQRYVVLERSDSGHCCFEFTVIDTQTPTKCSVGADLRPYTWVCECFDKADAERIAAALNATDTGAPCAAPSA